MDNAGKYIPSVIVVGNTGCGKTTNQRNIAKVLGLSQILDEPDPKAKRDIPEHGALVLTCGPWLQRAFPKFELMTYAHAMAAVNFREQNLWWWPDAGFGWPTEPQLGILRHAVGRAGDGTGTEYRNHYVPGDDDIRDCDALVAKGLMTRHDGSALSGGAPIFVVTKEGKGVARG